MNILLTGAWQNANKNIEKLESMGHTVVFMQFEKDELPCEYSWVEGVVCNGLFLSHSIEKFSNLKYIQLTSAGYDRVPMDYVKAHDIKIFNARGVYSIPMAEFAFAGILQLYKHLNVFEDNRKKCLWNKERNLLELFGKTVCIVGCGSVGYECAKRFKTFGCKVTGVATASRQAEYFDEIVSTENIDDVLAEADIIVLTLPLTDATYHLINEEKLSLMKTSAILVNIARGAVVDTHALVKSLENNKLGGAVLDVFEEEPLSEDSPLWKLGNVIITPHNSFVGENNSKRLDSVVLDNFSSFK